MKVADDIALCKIKHDVGSGKIKRIWHILNNSGTGSNEYTVCGLATPDNTMGMEGFEAEEYKHGGSVNCKECINFIEWCKTF